jgi:hypothetical protein
LYRDGGGGEVVNAEQGSSGDTAVFGGRPRQRAGSKTGELVTDGAVAGAWRTILHDVLLKVVSASAATATKRQTCGECSGQWGWKRANTYRRRIFHAVAMCTGEAV